MILCHILLTDLTNRHKQQYFRLTNTSQLSPSKQKSSISLYRYANTNAVRTRHPTTIIQIHADRMLCSTSIANLSVNLQAFLPSCNPVTAYFSTLLTQESVMVIFALELMLPGIDLRGSRSGPFLAIETRDLWLRIFDAHFHCCKEILPP